MERCSNQSRSMTVRSVFQILLAICLSIPFSSQADTTPTVLQVTLDATEISRKLLRSTIVLESGYDHLNLVYPKWIPGAHGPTGPIENVAEFKLTDNEGARVAWDSASRAWCRVRPRRTPVPASGSPPRALSLTRSRTRQERGMP